MRNCGQEALERNWNAGHNLINLALRRIFLVVAFSLVVPTWGALKVAKRPKILGLHEIDIHVSNELAANQFYGKLYPLLRNCTWYEKRPLADNSLLPDFQRNRFSTQFSEKPLNPLVTIDCQIDDVRSMMKFLRASKVPFDLDLPVDGDASLTVFDPDGHELQFIEPERGLMQLKRTVGTPATPDTIPLIMLDS